MYYCGGLILGRFADIYAHEQGLERDIIKP